MSETSAKNGAPTPNPRARGAFSLSKHARRDIKGEGVQAFHWSWDFPFYKWLTSSLPTLRLRIVFK